VYEIGFIDHFNTWPVTTSHYSALANLHTLQIIRALSQSFTACSVFTSSFLVTASNSGDFSASALLPMPAGYRLANSHNAPNCHGYNVSALTAQKTPFPTILVQLLLVKNLLHSSERCSFRGHYLVRVYTLQQCDENIACVRDSVAVSSYYRKQFACDLHTWNLLQNSIISLWIISISKSTVWYVYFLNSHFHPYFRMLFLLTQNRKSSSKHI
jgi:hypothetical protein